MEKTFEYKEQESAIFGQVRRPIIMIEVFSKLKNIWIPLYKVVADTGADISILPRFAGRLIVEDITNGKQIEIRGIVPYSKLICYIHELRFKIDDKEFELPVAIADSDDVPIILGRVNGLDLFRCNFDNGKKTVIQW